MWRKKKRLLNRGKSHTTTHLLGARPQVVVIIRIQVKEIFDFLVEVCQVVLEIIQHRQNRAVVVVWRKRLQADIAQRDRVVSHFCCYFLDFRLQVQYLRREVLATTNGHSYYRNVQNAPLTGKRFSFRKTHKIMLYMQCTTHKIMLYTSVSQLFRWQEPNPDLWLR